MKLVLLVEDNPDDVLLITRACARAEINHQLKIFNDGDAAIGYLEETARHERRSQNSAPALVFLDIKLPRRTGHEVLAWIRSRREFEHLPVIMLTGSDEPKDIERAYQLGATSYVCKAADPRELRRTVRVVLSYWLRLNTPAGLG